jgi:hypothetical protein
MSDYIPETPAEIPVTCGFCYPDLDFEAYIHQACSSHIPDLAGSADEMSRHAGNRHFITGTLEAGGQDNAAICDAIHRGDA